jgi:membrane protein implicated in regulation of membrane protease activity
MGQAVREHPCQGAGTIRQASAGILPEGRRDEMPAWLVWVIVAAVLGGVEMLSLTLVAGLLGVAAVAAAVTAALGVGGAGQAAAFAVTSGVSIAILLPALCRHRRSLTSRPRSGVAALVGQSAQVLELVDAQHGRVRIGGEIWSARAYVPERVIPVGRVVDVFELQGATALVYAEDTT